MPRVPPSRRRRRSHRPCSLPLLTFQSLIQSGMEATTHVHHRIPESTSPFLSTSSGRCPTLLNVSHAKVWKLIVVACLEDYCQLEECVSACMWSTTQTITHTGGRPPGQLKMVLISPPMGKQRTVSPWQQSQC